MLWSWLSLSISIHTHAKTSATRFPTSTAMHKQTPSEYFKSNTTNHFWKYRNRKLEYKGVYEAIPLT